MVHSIVNVDCNKEIKEVQLLIYIIGLKKKQSFKIVALQKLEETNKPIGEEVKMTKTIIKITKKKLINIKRI